MFPRAFHSAGTPSALEMVENAWAMPLYCPLLSSCSRVFTTSMGCRQSASTTPPRLPPTALA